MCCSGSCLFCIWYLRYIVWQHNYISTWSCFRLRYLYRFLELYDNIPSYSVYSTCLVASISNCSCFRLRYPVWSTRSVWQNSFVIDEQKSCGSIYLNLFLFQATLSCKMFGSCMTTRSPVQCLRIFWQHKSQPVFVSGSMILFGVLELYDNILSRSVYKNGLAASSSNCCHFILSAGFKAYAVHIYVVRC